MSHASRWQYSDIDAQGVAATVSGWRRSWNMACSIENFTCVGVLPEEESQTETTSLNGKLFPVAEISENLQKREQNYYFTQIPIADLTLWNKTDAFPWTDDFTMRVWICALRNAGQASPTQPIYQSYVDTCLVGCLEDVGEAFARRFIQSTSGWQSHWENDREQAKYPRGAKITPVLQEHIDQLLAEEGVLQFRRNG